MKYIDFLSVAKDLVNSNCWADMFLLSSEASHRSREGLYTFWGRLDFPRPFINSP